MTAIVGITEGGKVWIGADSAGSTELSLRIRKSPKVFISGEFLIGYTTSFRMGQLLEFCFTPPNYDENADGSLVAFMVRRFVPAIRAVFKEGGYQRVINEQEEGGQFLVGYRGELFEILDDYQVADYRLNYAACGSGHELALGSLYSSSGDPETRITLALEAAAMFSNRVAPPFVIRQIGR